MNIARIVRIEPDGKPFTTANGTFYPYVVGFDDHRSGQANSKSNPPPWKVGEVVGYEVTGQTPRGADKFKIKRNPEPQDGTYNPPHAEDHSNPDLEAAQPPARTYAPKAVAPRSVPQNRPSELPVNLPNGQTVGMAVKAAVDIWLAGEEGKVGGWSEVTAARVEEIARSIVAMNKRIESGHPQEWPQEENPF